MMHHIRPHELFCRFKTASYADRLMTIVMPDDHTPRLLDTAILVALCRLVQPDVIYEFGTGRGIQTMNLAIASRGAIVYTIDLPDASRAHPDDVAVASSIRESMSRWVFMPDPRTDGWWQIRPIVGDSRLCAIPLPFGRTLVYVDGGHAEEVVRSDTARAFELVQQYPGGAIVWHDYSPEWPGVARVLDELAEREDLEHVEETSLVLWGARR